MNIIVLSDQKKFSRSFNDFFPLYKWQKKLSQDGFKIEIYTNHLAIEKKTADVFLISSRYPFSRRDDFKELFTTLRKRSAKVVLFDASDTTGIVDFDLIEFVDAIFKKQVLKDVSFYTKNQLDLSVRPWLPAMPANPVYPDYLPCSESSLKKIKTGWNLGLCDYRYFPGYTGVVRNYFPYNLPGADITKQMRNKNIFTSYRGEVNYGNKEVSFQRNKVLEVLHSSGIPAIVLGGRVERHAYLSELAKSRVGVSPFGWGEICYRDFEIMYKGALLVKPSMNHINTFPDIYKDGVTYIEIDWLIGNLHEKLVDIHRDYNGYQQIALQAHHEFMAYQNSYTLFSSFFKSLIISI